MPFANTVSQPSLRTSSRYSCAARIVKTAAMGLACLMPLMVVPTALSATAETQKATVTALNISAAGNPVTSVASGTVVTLTAQVTADGAAVTPGQVNFCDAAAKYCTDIHLLGTAQLTKAGTAVMRFRPGIGSQSYKAVFLGTNTDADSSSAALGLAVTGPAGPSASTTTISESGSWGNYTLGATVTEVGRTAAPSGTVSFLDSSRGNAVVGRGALGVATPGLSWPSVTSPASNADLIQVAVGDFNGDGVPDMAVRNAGSGGLAIYLGNGDGTFRAGQTLGAEFYVNAIAVGDFNGDDIEDLAVANGSVVTIFLGQGDGTFTAIAPSPATGTDPAAIAVADFNGDGIADLAVANANYGGVSTVTILLGKGDGTFSKPSASPSVGSGAYSIVAADFNRDGKMDMAVSAQNSGVLTILLGNGNGTFTAAASPAGNFYTNEIAAADLKGNGTPDLIVLSSDGGLVQILMGNGDGTFTVAPSISLGADSQPDAVAVADFNQDGIPDIAVLTSYPTGEIQVFMGNGGGSFAQYGGSLPAGYSPGAMAAGDFDGDGRTDFAVANISSVGILAYLTEPTETATAAAVVSLPAAGEHLVEASYAGEGEYEQSISSATPLWGAPPSTSTSLSVTAGNAIVTSATPGTIVTLTAEVKAGGIALRSGQVNFCDATAPHCTDIHIVGTASVTNNGTATYKFAPGTGQHSYKAESIEDGLGQKSASNVVSVTVEPAPPVEYSVSPTIALSGVAGDYSLVATVEGFGGPAAPAGKVSFIDTSFSNAVLATALLGPATSGMGWLINQTPAFAGEAPIAEVSGDFNGDGIPDLAVLWTTNIYSGAAVDVTIFLGKGDGAFTAGPTAQALSSYPSYPAMIAGDFNGDGNADLAILSWNGYSENFINTLLGNGDGSFGAPIVSVGYNQGAIGGDGIPGSLVAADFNGDGKMDLAIVGDNVGSGATILLGKGDGSFAAAGANVAPTQDFSVIAAGDFNGDGIPDLIAANYFSPGGATVLLGKGDGTFIVGQQLTVDNFPSSMVTGDFNGDGKLDVALGYSGGVTVLLGKGDGTFSLTPGGGTFQGAGLSLVEGDFNGDGILDLAGLDNNNAQIDLFEGAGNGTFKEIVTTPNVSQTSSGPLKIVAADFNKKGMPDLAMLTTGQNTASILLTEPTETVTATVTGIAPVGAGTHNVEASYSGDSHYSKSASSTVQLTAGLAPLVITPASGTYSAVQEIRITEAIPGATIYYQASGTVNTQGYVEYTGPFFLPFGGFEEISAYATETGYQQSNYTFATFNLTLPAAPKPVSSPVAGSYKEAQKVTITDAAPEAKIYYTTNGEFPTLASTVYSGPISVSTSELISAIAIAPGYSVSGVVSAQYLIGSSQSRFVSTVAGTQSTGYSGDGGPATFASLEYPTTVARDASGNLYIGDEYTVRRIAAGSGIISTFAGNGQQGYSGDGGPATKAELGYVGGLAFDKAGDLYIADETHNVVRRIAAGSGTIATIAGNGKPGYTGDNGPATEAELGGPYGLAVDQFGDLYIGTSGAIRKVAAGTSTITTFAGNGDVGYEGDGGPATKAEVAEPSAMVFDAFGDLYFADGWANVVRRIAAGTTMITTVAGTGPRQSGTSGNGDGGPATSATLSDPQGLAIDAAGDLFISDTYNGAVREVTASNKIISSIADGEASCSALGGDGGPAIAANLCYPFGLTIDPAGNLYVSDPDYSTVREITALVAPPTASTASPLLSLAPGTYATAKTLTITAAPGVEVYLTLNGSVPTTSGEGYYTPIAINGPVTVKAVALEPGRLPSEVVTATYNVTAPAPATITTIAGSGVVGNPGTGGPAREAEFGYLYGIATDSTGNLYIADPNNGAVWKLTAATRTVSVVAGTPGTRGSYFGEGGPATKAVLNFPEFVTLDAAGDLFISDSQNYRVFKVSAATGIISTYAGGGQTYNYPTFGDGGPATDAQLQDPQGIAFDKLGNLYIADSSINRIRRVNATTGIITSVAGSTTATALGDGGQATAAMLSYPANIALDGSGDLYIVDQGDSRIRAVASKTGIITTVAGTGIFGSSADGVLATHASIGPWGIAVDSSGTIYFGNVDNTVRMFVPGGAISTIAGTGYWGFAGDGGPARMAELCGRAGLGLDKTGTLYIADGCNYRVRQVSFSKTAAASDF